MANTMGNKLLHVLGISGSLRERSYNSALLRAAQELAPEGMEITIFSLHNIPLYNGDVEAVGLPESVLALKSAIKETDGLLLATPEYNYSMSGVLKNAIDWASRPPRDSALAGKPLAIMGASNSLRGTARAQMHLRQSAVFTNMIPLNKPEVLVDSAAQRFDEDLNLTDETTRQFTRQLLEAFAEWIERLRRPL